MLKSSKAIRWSIFSIIINSNISLAEPIYTNSEVLPINLCTKPKVAGIPKESAFGWDANSVDCLKGITLYSARMGYMEQLITKVK